jgi:hypothetical protein
MLDALTLEPWEMEKAISVSQVLMVRPYVFEGSRKELCILSPEFCKDKPKRMTIFQIQKAPLLK